MPYSPVFATQHGQSLSQSAPWRKHRKRTVTFVTMLTVAVILLCAAIFTASVASKENDMKPITDNPTSNNEATSSNSSTNPSPTPGVSNDTAQQTTTATTTRTNVNADGSVNTQVTVNGKEVPVQDNGSVHKTIVDANGTTTVDVSNTSGGQSSNASSSSLNVNVSTNASSFSSDFSSTVTTGGATGNN